jgi:hypothetical protein
MSAEHPRELMVLVERVVRPLPLPLARRMRARRELLEHLQMTYDEELARDADAQAALVRVQDRFGDPQNLSLELQATIRPWEFWQARSQVMLAQQPGTSTAWYALRMAFSVGLLLAFLFGVAFALRHTFGEPTFVSERRLFAGLVVCQTIWTACFIYFGLRTGAAWDQSPRRWNAILANAVGLFAAAPFAWAVLMAFVTGSLTSDRLSLAGTLVAGVLTVLAGIVVGVLHHREQASYFAWTELTIDTV